MPRKKQLTLRDLAKIAGVSATTVSYALRDDPRITERERKRIRRLARTRGYVVNPLVSAWMAHVRTVRPIERHEVIAFIVCRDPRKPRLFPTLRRYREGASERAGQLGYRLDYFDLADYRLDGLRMSEVLRARGIRGGVLELFPEWLPRIELDWSALALVSIDPFRQGPPVNFVAPNQYQGMKLALARLRERGRRRIGYVNFESADDRADNGWAAAFLHEQGHRHTKDFIPPWLREEDGFNEEAFRRWYRRHEPDAIVTNQHVVLDWLKKLGATVPGDCAFANLDWDPERPPHAGVEVNGASVGAAAVDLVIEQMNHNLGSIPAHAKSVRIDGEWVDGPTA